MSDDLSGYFINDDDGTCQAEHPAEPGVRCLRKAGHGPGDMHDGRMAGNPMGFLWPNERGSGDEH